MEKLKEDYAKNKEQILKEFFTFLKFESISTDPAYNTPVKECANWLVDYIKASGFQVEVWPTAGHPVIFASNLSAGPDKPTLLIYNHYDVQPIDPLNLWTTPPFEPTIKNGEIYARGAQDNKGQCFYVIQALRALFKSQNGFPLNIKLCIEGEEECGSTNLSSLLKKEVMQKQLKADYLAIVDMGIRTPDVPAITLGVRGLITFEVRLQGSKTDLHSGSHGGIAYNPLHALVEILAKLHDKEGHVTVPGFYEDLIELDPEAKELIAWNFDPHAYELMFGAKPLGGEKNYSPWERAWNRPTLEINGLAGGYTGPGFKTVIPAKALAKISCRLISNQDPLKISERVIAYIKELTPQGIECEVELLKGGGKAIRANPHSILVKAFAQAYEELFQKPCEYIFDGGSIPIVTQLAEVSQSEVILLGLGLPNDQIHAPNEHFGIDRLEKGFLVMYRALEILGTINTH